MTQPPHTHVFVTQNKDLWQFFSISGREMSRKTENFPTSKY